MKHYHAIRHLTENKTFGKGDVLVLFGELFQRGYANGLVDEAQRRGMTMISSTVGRREKDHSLRPLTTEESSHIPRPLINVPLEAGFDLEPATAGGPTPVDFLKELKLQDWKEAKLNQDLIHQSQKNGHLRFQKQLDQYMKELEALIPPGANVLFAHIMAGGVPRAKIIMPLMNRVFKGTGDRHLSSQEFWESSIGQLCSESFFDVTAETFNQLILSSEKIRNKVTQNKKKVAYLAYGYHGTEVLIGNNYTWQTYTPYLQGWAKMRLEDYSQEWSQKGVTTCVYNCPEILTNSSSIFQGVEISLYPLLSALKKESPHSPQVQKIIEKCTSLIKKEVGLEQLIEYVNSYLQSETIRQFCNFEKWPQHNTKVQMEKMLETSNGLYDMHQNPKEEILPVLSEVVFQACGKMMLNDIAHPESPVSWLNHDVIAKNY